MPSLLYLTVQDVLWINLQITKRTQPFNYAKLEEATYYQYGYGRSVELLPQAARFLEGFLRLAPFAEGNEATGLVACEAFLRINGWMLRLTDDDAGRWLLESRGKESLTEELRAVAVEDPDFHPSITPNVREAVSAALERLPKSVAGLTIAAAPTRG